MLEGEQVSKDEIGFFVAHPGGPKVLRAIEEALALNNGELKHSWDGLKEFGNMSAVSALLALQTNIRNGLPKNKHGLMMAMGPAFCTEMTLLHAE